jgi:uncharacterized protein
MKVYRLTLLLLVALFGILLIKKPIQWGLQTLITDTLMIDLVASTTARILAIVFCLLVIARYGLSDFNGLNANFKIKNAHALIIPIGIASMGIVGNFDFYSSSEPILFSVFVFSNLAIGFTEEIFFRGILFSMFTRLAKRKGHIIVAALVSSLIFGLIHYVNLLKDPDNFSGVTSQVFFAFSIGVFFAGLFVRVQNIVPVAMVHALINIGFGSGSMSRSVVSHVRPDSDLGDFIVSLVIFSLIVFSGVFMILLSDEKETMERVRMDGEEMKVEPPSRLPGE